MIFFLRTRKNGLNSKSKIEGLIDTSYLFSVSLHACSPIFFDRPINIDSKMVHELYDRLFWLRMDTDIEE